MFASACVGALMNGKDLAGALKIAVDYTLECIRETQNDPDARWYGVNFESASHAGSQPGTLILLLSRPSSGAGLQAGPRIFLKT